MNFKKIMAGTLASIFMMSTAANAKTLEFTVGSENMYVSDEKVEQKTLDTAPYISNGRTMIPVRVVSESFDAQVEWDEAARKVTIKDGNTVIELFIGSTTAYVNGAATQLDTAPVITDGRTIVPLRFISETLGKNVEYVPASKQVLISDQKPVITIDGYPFTVEDYKYLRNEYGYNVAGADILNFINGITLLYATQIIPVANYAKINGYTLTEAQCQELYDSITSYKDSIYTDALVAPGIKLYADELIATSFLNDVTQNDPYFTITQEDIEEEYINNYIRAKHILILTQDAQTGEPMNSRDKAKAKARAEEILKKISKGEDFDTLMNEYCEDPGAAQQPNGYVFTYGEMISEFEEAAFALEVGQVSKIVETPYGYHIIKREELPEMDEYTRYTLSQTITNGIITEYIAALAANSNIETNMTTAELEEILTITE